MNIEDEYDVKLIPIAKARAMLSRLPEILAKEDRAAAITRRGKPVLLVLSWDRFESAVETAEIMEDPEMMDALRRSMEGIPEEDLISMEEVAARLGD